MNSPLASNPKVISDPTQEPLSQEEHEQTRAAKQLAGQKKDKPTMMVKVESPFSSYFNGSAFSLSGVNATGPFDILPKHHNFISLLVPCNLVIRTISGEEQKIAIGGGLLHVKSDRVIVFLDV